MNRLVPNGRKKNKRRGALTVELALTVPILFLLVLGAVELSRANMIRNTAENAAYEGARHGIVPGASADEVRQETQTVLAAVGIRDANITVSPSVIQTDTPEITVTVSIPMDSNGLITPRYLRNSSVTRSITLTREALANIPDPGNVGVGGGGDSQAPQQAQTRRQQMQQMLQQWFRARNGGGQRGGGAGSGRGRGGRKRGGRGGRGGRRRGRGRGRP